jgi:hypothetical protein
MGLPGAAGATGATGATGPQGPAGPMPYYQAARILASGSLPVGVVVDFTSQKTGTGQYKLVFPPAPSGKSLAVSVTPLSSVTPLIGVVTSYSRDALVGSPTFNYITVLIELRSFGGVLTDADYFFNAIERSGS